MRPNIQFNLDLAFIYTAFIIYDLFTMRLSIVHKQTVVRLKRAGYSYTKIVEMLQMIYCDIKKIWHGPYLG